MHGKTESAPEGWNPWGQDRICVLTQRQLLMLCAVLEGLAGLALILAPGEAMLVLFGAAPGNVGLMLGPVAGIALAAIGICCFGARTGPDGKGHPGTLQGITFYNAGVGLFLLYLAAGGQAHGVLVWGASILHLVLAAQYFLARAAAQRAVRQ